MKFIDSLKKRKKRKKEEDIKIEEGLVGQRIEINRGRGKEMALGVTVFTYTVCMYANVRMDSLLCITNVY